MVIDCSDVGRVTLRNYSCQALKTAANPVIRGDAPQLMLLEKGAVDTCSVQNL